jgi:RecA/RadA recombinase
MAKEKQVKEEQKELTPEQLISLYLKDNKEDHYNYQRIDEYTVSTGSLTLDMEMGGGIRPSVLRLSGVTEGGKTSEALQMMFDFLRDTKESRGLLIQGEGRLGKEVQERSGLKFIYKPEDWKDGTCFVYICNIFESSINLMRSLVKNNHYNKRYFMIIDSLDSLERREDMAKTFEEAVKVAGSALLSSLFLKRMAIAYSSLGHFCLLLSQVRANIKINPYEKGDPKITNATGGNAALHYSDWILEFQQRWQKDAIWDGEEGKSNRIGHYCKIIFRKSCNEKTGKEVTYPIKYGRKNGTSIWIEREIYDFLLMWNMIDKRNKGWIDVSVPLIEELEREIQVKIPEKIQGESNFVQYLEENQKVVEYLKSKFKKLILDN